MDSGYEYWDGPVDAAIVVVVVVEVGAVVVEDVGFEVFVGVAHDGPVIGTGGKNSSAGGAKELQRQKEQSQVDYC